MRLALLSLSPARGLQIGERGSCSTIHDWCSLNLGNHGDLIPERHSARLSYSAGFHSSYHSTEINSVASETHSCSVLSVLIFMALSINRIASKAHGNILPNGIWSEESFAFNFVILSLVLIAWTKGIAWIVKVQTLSF